MEFCVKFKKIYMKYISNFKNNLEELRLIYSKKIDGSFKL